MKMREGSVWVEGGKNRRKRGRDVTTWFRFSLTDKEIQE